MHRCYVQRAVPCWRACRPIPSLASCLVDESGLIQTHPPSFTPVDILYIYYVCVYCTALSWRLVQLLTH